MKRIGTITLLVGLLVVAVTFSLGITDGHVGLDDWGYTGGCPFVRGGLRWGNVVRAFRDLGYGAIWMPLTFMSYMVDVSVFGESMRAHHAVNVALHLVNVFLVYCLLKAILARFLPEASASAACAVAAMLWALHPMRAESVVLVASRKEELWTLFALLGLLAYGKFRVRPTVACAARVLLCFALSCLSKPTAMCFPFLVLALAYLSGRLDRRTWLLLAPMFVLSAGVGLLTVHSQAHPANAVAVDVYGSSVAWRFLNAAVSVGLYFWYTVWPTGIHLDYRAVFGGWPVDGWLGLASLAAVATAAVLAHVRGTARTRRLLLGAGLLFFFSLGPTLGIFGYVNGDQAMADRYAYFPQVAAALILACALAARCGGSRLILGLGTVLAALELTVLVPAVRSCKNDYAAATRTLARDPDNWRALRVVGNEYCARLSRMDEGVAMLRKSLRLRRSQRTADSLAYVLAFRGAEGDFGEVKRLGAGVVRNPRLDEGGMMLDALGIVSMREGDFAAAARSFSAGLKAVRRNHSPDYSMLYLGQCLANAGRRREAADVLVRAERSRIKDVAERSRAALTEIAQTRGRTSFTWK